MTIRCFQISKVVDDFERSFYENGIKILGERSTDSITLDGVYVSERNQSLHMPKKKKSIFSSFIPGIINSLLCYLKEYGIFYKRLLNAVEIDATLNTVSDRKYLDKVVNMFSNVFVMLSRSFHLS